MDPPVLRAAAGQAAIEAAVWVRSVTRGRSGSIWSMIWRVERKPTEWSDRVKDGSVLVDATAYMAIFFQSTEMST